MRWAVTFLIVIVAGAVAQQLPVPPELARVSLEAPARVGLPVWLKISTDREIRYPFYVVPDFRACHDVEVRKDGMPFPRIMHSSSAIELGIMFAGNLCGSLPLPGMPKHPGSIPLHVMYRFDKPGVYEVRYVRRAMALGSKSAEVASPWTRIEIEPATSEDRTRWLADVSAHAPTDATSLLTGYLPDLLGVPDEMSLRLLAPYLHDPDNLVRGYVTYALAYWPGEQAKKAVLGSILAQGPSEESARLFSSAKAIATADETESAIRNSLTYLRSNSKMGLTGAIDAVAWIGLREDSPISAALKTRAVDALIDAEAHVVALGDTDIANAYAAALGTVHDDRASKILWRFVDRHIDGGQALIALTWLHAPSDLQRLARLAFLAPSRPGDGGPASLPYSLHQGYGDAALPYIEDMLQHSPFVWVRTASARELILAGRPSGFAFIADAIEQKQPYRQELIQYLRDRFPEIDLADDTAVSAFARMRANTR